VAACRPPRACDGPSWPDIPTCGAAARRACLRAVAERPRRRRSPSAGRLNQVTPCRWASESFRPPSAIEARTCTLADSSASAILKQIGLRLIANTTDSETVREAPREVALDLDEPDRRSGAPDLARAIIDRSSREAQVYPGLAVLAKTLRAESRDTSTTVPRGTIRTGMWSIREARSDPRLRARSRGSPGGHGVGSGSAVPRPPRSSELLASTIRPAERGGVPAGRGAPGVVWGYPAAFAGCSALRPDLRRAGGAEAAAQGQRRRFFFCSGAPSSSSARRRFSSR